MRQDFRHVYHTGGHRRANGYVKPTMGRPPRDWDAHPLRQGMAISHDRDDGNRSDRAWRLPERWLLSRDGMRWDDVWSEICSANDPRTDTGRQVRESFLRKVDRTTYRDADGIVRSGSSYCSRRRFGLDRNDNVARSPYVDPEGVLRSSKRGKPRWKRPAAPITVIRMGNDVQHRQIEGCWYAVTWRFLPPKEGRVKIDAEGMETIAWMRPVIRSVLGKGDGYGRCVDTGEPIYAAEKRQLSRAELAKAGLANDPDMREMPNLRL